VTGPEVVVHHDEQSLAEAIAARLVSALVDAGSATSGPHVCLTGGGIGTACLTTLAASPARDAVDWPRLNVWWGDERYLPAGDPERNETGARAALLDHVPVQQDRVHPMPATGHYVDVEAAAAAYAAELRAAARPEDHGPSPSFDVCLLGIGPDAHVASLFGEHPALHADGTVVAVHGSPKPPPTRISLTMSALCRSREVWVLASGAAKAHAVRMALDPSAGPLQVPASGARGRERTVFLLDEAAAADLPPGLRRVASP
jgi:6-phosphogluconolactonase